LFPAAPKSEPLKVTLMAPVVELVTGLMLDTAGTL
jgi:hypothetical protein